MLVYAIIPARSGSKGIPDKNIMPFRGKPLIAHSIDHANDSKIISRVIVTTDSEHYAMIARSYGAEVPFIRPDEYSTDEARDIDVFTHALQWLGAHEESVPDIVVHLRPTCPVRRVEDVDAAISKLIMHHDADSLRSICVAPITPYKMWRVEDGTLKPLLDAPLHEPWNAPRQLLPVVYAQNACIDVVRVSTILEKQSMTGDRILGYEMNDMYDIDDVLTLEQALVSPPHTISGLTFCFDIDGVLADHTPGLNYSAAEPILDNIALVNQLYLSGNIIKLYTARGSVTGIDWSAETESQMNQWGLLYHELHFGKPDADYYIDDRYVSMQAIASWLRKV